MKPSVPKAIAGIIAAAKGAEMTGGPETRGAPEITSDMRRRETRCVATSDEVGSATEARTSATEVRRRKMCSAAEARTAAAEVTACTAEVRTSTAEVRTSAAEVSSAATEVRAAAATTEVSPAEMTAAMRRSDHHRRKAESKRCDDCQHCPAHDFPRHPSPLS
jgi:hypothetical protein